MKLKSSTLWILAIALGVAGGVALFETQSTQKQAQQQQQAKLFGFAEADIQQLTLKLGDRTVQLDRRANFQPGQTLWELRLNRGAAEPASDGAVAFLTSLLASSQRDRTIERSPAQLAELGLDRPRAEITMRLKTGQQHRLAIGQAGFDDSFLYALVDPPQPLPGKVSVALIPKDFQLATVDRPLAEWKQPPPPPSPSPSGSVTPSPTAGPTVSPTASPTASPSPTTSPSPAASP
ncbi:DUF4340 domain-containing protein [Limnothrix sp. FACHB-708]|uniref:DUF4340 domain-containing protein n=1 Tax=unclassified Limnothrix TaxID=2632864 RepID=UPI0016839300|nr:MULTISPECIES: DUF4340 domain-containing protein [unclassified Limnothrix]MBD2553226.1 DUF4340 domain-containing protein [Limnothrix sp. FACHB-708]MBD2590750.1 DUF4340 domain-containing protein [Limnothrix sp. FACHB-406]